MNAQPNACFWCAGQHSGVVCEDAPYYSDVEWAKYFSVRVQVVKRFTHLALIRRPDGLSCVVESADLEVRA